MTRRAPAVTLLFLLAGCGDAGSVGDGAAVVRTDTIGDTITIRSPSVGVWGGVATLAPRVEIGTLDGPAETVFGSIAGITAGADGDIYVLDRQAVEIRAFGRDGGYVRTLGRRGEGPGEMAQPMAVGAFPDGRIAVRDPRNARVQLWSPDGSETSEWPVVASTYYSADPLWVDGTGTAWVVTKGVTTDPTRPAPTVVVRVDAEGAVLDTIPDPGEYVAQPRVSASNPSTGTLSTEMTVPYHPRGTWAVHPDGSLLRGTVDGAGVELVERGGETRRYIRATEPVPVPDPERSAARDQIVSSMREVDPNWRWDGPEIPRTKPHVARVFSGRDGRIWVAIATPSREVENPFHDLERAGSLPTMWTAPLAFDVYESDGTYLGLVDVGDAFRTHPMPVFDTGGVWAVTRDELGIDRVVWFDLVLPE